MATMVRLVLFFASLTLGGLLGSGVQAQAECKIEANGFTGDSISGHVGQSYILSCSCQNVDQAVTYTWTKNNTLISEETESSLTLSQLKLSDAGKYFCSIELNGVVYNSSIDITIQIPAPSYVIISSNKPNPIRPIGSNVTLTCMVGLQPSTASTTIPLNLTILVKDPAGNALSTALNSVNGSTYTSRATIGSFGRSQSGVYMCDATLTSPSLHLSESSTVTEEVRLNSGVYLSLGRAIGIQNNTCASISQIGSSPPHQLACVTDRKPCCLNQGEWYYPNGSQVRGRSSDQNSYYVERTNKGSVNLFRYNDTLEPHGKFCCKIADNSDATYTACIDLVPPVSILIDDKGVTPVAGLNYSLACKVLGIDTTVMYTWKKDDAPLSEVGPTLSFSPLRISDAGQYSCAISVHDCPFKRMKHLTIEQVFQPVSVTLTSDPISPLGIAGSNVTVTCTAELNSAIDVPVNILIRLTDPDGGALATTTGIARPRSMASYMINSFRREHTGLYTCTVTLSSPRLQESVITKAIHIHVGVQLTLKGTIYRNNSFFFLNELGRIESDDALQCITDKVGCCKYSPNRFGEWYFPNGSRIPIEGDSREFYRNRGYDGTVNLNYRAPLLPPTGHYCCRVPNAADVSQTLCANILLAVQIGENTAPQIGLSDYALTCTISGTVNRNVTYRWIKDSSTQIWNSTGTNSSILSFASPLKLSDAGNYTCEVLIPRESPSLANSVMARAEASWVVTMEIPPLTDVSIVSDPPSPIRPIGARVRLNCSYDTASSLPSEYTDVDIIVRFSLTDATGRRLTTTAPMVSGSVYSSSAVINSFQWDQSGLYNCQVDVNTRSSFIVGTGKFTMKRITVGVYLSFGGRIIPSHRTIIVTDIGTSSPNQLICTSDRKPCCQDQPQYGGWYFPNRSQVAHISEQPTPTAFHSDRNRRGEISLYRTSIDVKSPVGRFCCETIDATDTNLTLCITVSPPIVANITTEGTARVGQPYTLVCSVLSGLEGLMSAAVSYQWTKDNGTRSHLGANSYTLSFPSLRLSDAGLYTCEIMVNSSRLLKQATIRTATQVKVSIPQPSIDVISSAPNPILTGSSPTLLCIVELHPAVNVPVNLNFVWISPHDSTLMSTLVIKSSSLYINKVVLSDISLEDAGQYTCKATIGSEAIIGSDISVSAQRDVEIGDGMFQLRLKYTDDCREWYKSSLGEMEMYKHFIEEALVEAIKLRCECHFPRENLLQESFSCSSSPHLTTYRNTLVGTHNVNASQLVGFIQDWVNSGPRITIKGGYSVWVDKKCPVAVSSFDEPECGEE